MACQGMKIILNLILLFIWFPGFPGIRSLPCSLPVAICEFPIPSRKTGMWFSISLPVPGSQKAFPAHPCSHLIDISIFLSKSSLYFPGFAGESSERVFHPAKRLFLFRQLLEEENHKTLDWKKESGQRSLATRRIQQGRTCQAKGMQKKQDQIQKLRMVENISLFTKERQTPLS